MSELTDFLQEHGCPPDSIADIVEGVKRSFERARRGMTSRVELKIKAQNLEAASREIVKALSSLFPQETDEHKASPAHAKALASANELHLFLSKAEALSSLDDCAANKRGKLEQRVFQKKIKVISQNPKALHDAFKAIADACKIVTDSNRPRPVLAKNGNAFDETRKMLGFELAAFWHVATKKNPTHSGKGVPESPATPFGMFVVLSTREFAADGLISKGFSGFVKRACEDYLASDLAKGVMTSGV